MKENNGKETILNIYIGLRSSLARAVMGIVPPREVEDIVQETYVRVCQVKHPEDIRQPRSYLFRTARNLALDYLKRADTKLTDGMDEQGMDSLLDTSRGDDSTYDQVASNEEFALFCEAVRHLPVKCRRVFVLKKVYGYTQIEIARELDISIGTVEKHISQGIKRCTYFMQRNNHKADQPDRGQYQQATGNLAERVPKGPQS
ncbi:putative RNA polymerase sigma factor FecI [Gammaproteobacteria bacterium MOLA455]|nr:putative RNA polymerase sigma factor FecI [Gammaproteobacteria bacterium MOLA455]